MFPYDEFRPFQREIYEKTYEGLTEGVPVLINAPTGIGKTAAVLAAALKYSEEVGATIHYAVRTRNELDPPLRELAKMAEKGLDVNYVVIKSRQDMCCYPQLRKMGYLEFLAECSLLKRMGHCAYYPPQIAEEVQLKNVASYVKYLCAARACPYEYAKIKLRDARVVISTYYYLFREETPKGAVILIDEAHALFDSVISLHTIKLSELDIRIAYRELRKYGMLDEAAKLYRLLTYIRKIEGPVDTGDLLALISELEIDRDVWEIARRKIEERLNPYTPLLIVKELYSSLREKTRKWAEIVVEETGKTLVVAPLDPVSIVKKALEGARGVVYLSGTLPLSMFVDLMSLRQYKALDIPFNSYIPKENYLPIIDIGVTTRFQERTEEMYLKIAERLAHAVNATSGGFLAVFPSYEVMKGVRKYLKLSIPHWYEGSADPDWSNLPDRFFIGAVAGGRYTEGIEYVRDKRNILAAVAIIGVPYPEPTPYLERRVELLRPTLKERAWSAVYLYQAVINVRQAIGRLFRSPRDRGVLIFLDRRYAEPELWENLKDILQGSHVVSHVGEIAEKIASFLSLTQKTPQGDGDKN